MAVRAQPSSSSLSRYAVSKAPGVDIYNGNPSRDFCNSFWGLGDGGVNIVFARMRGAARTSDDLRNFWKERSLIEEEYAQKLSQLAKTTIGKDEIGVLRNALDTLKHETEKLSNSHLDLANQIRTEMENTTTALLNKQVEHRRQNQTPLEKKFKTKQNQEAYVLKAREKYQGDCLRIASYSQQIEVNQGRDVERIQAKLQRAQQTVKANEQDYASFSGALNDFMPSWEGEWKEFCDSCQDLEEERIEFLKDNLWTYANAVSTVCVSDDLSCEAIRTVLDQLEPDRDIESFVNEYGTGSTMPEPPVFVPYSSQADFNQANATKTHPARFTRSSKRPAPSYLVSSEPPPVQQQPPQQGTTGANSRPYGQGQGQGQGGIQQSPPQQHLQPPKNVGTNGIMNDNRPTSRPISTPLPPQPAGRSPYGSNEPISPVPPMETGGILFYVKALYDYTATIDEEFDFQAGDVIAVRATPDDGWWSGELLDEARREEGRHIFPSNFVCLF